MRSNWVKKCYGRRSTIWRFHPYFHALQAIAVRWLAGGIARRMRGVRVLRVPGDHVATDGEAGPLGVPLPLQDRLQNSSIAVSDQQANKHIARQLEQFFTANRRR